MAVGKSTLWYERVKAACIKRSTHGKTANRKRPPEYEAWRAMKKRCLLVNDPGFKNYGGRGIKVCSRWIGRSGFQNFIIDLGIRPSPDHSLGRIDNDGNYEPSNCRWETQTQQCRNRRSNVRHVFQGMELTVPEISEICGIPVSNLQLRLRGGWSIEVATTVPVNKRKQRKRYWECLDCGIEWMLPVKEIQKQCVRCHSEEIIFNKSRRN